jgi:ATP-dependent Clp protease ATP-binding subunit ClpC
MQTVKTRYERFDAEVLIKQFPKDQCKLLIDEYNYSSIRDPKAYVVSVCVENFGWWVSSIKKYCQINPGMQPTFILHELYELCVEVNPSLKLHNAQAQATGRGAQQPEQQQEKRFKDVTPEELLSLEQGLTKIVIGQDTPISIVSKSILRASAGLKDPEQPIGCFLFTGPTGVGKTYLAKVLAESLVGDKCAFHRIDCSEYSQGHEYAKLIGSPPGYVGHDTGGVLTTAVRTYPFSVVLFDEIEKAHEKVYNILLQIMDEASLQDSRGFKASFSDSIIIMTSNLGVEEQEKIVRTIGVTPGLQTVTPEKRIKALEDSLKKNFKPEFLNRLDEVAHFMPLESEACLEIAKLELEKVLGFLKANKNIEIKYDEDVVDFIFDRGFDKVYGARPLRRCIKKEFANPLAYMILTEKIEEETVISAKVKDNKIQFIR